MKHNRQSIGHWLVVAAVLAVGLPALHAGGLDEFKLTRGIPADVFMVSHTRGHDGQAFLNKQVQRVWDALENAHLERDIRKLFRGMAEAEGQGEAFEENWQKINDLLAGVEWSALAKQESAFAMKLEFPVPQWVVLMTPEAGKAKGSFESLSGMMQALVDFAPEGELILTKDDQSDVSVHKIGFAQAPFPVGFVLARQKDTLMFSFGTSMPEQVLAMLSGQGGSSLSASDRFKKAFSGLPTPTDGAFFIDSARLIKQLRDYASNAMAMMPPPMEGEAGGAPDIAKIINNVLDAVDMLDYSATVAATDGKRTQSQTTTVLREGAQSTSLYAALFANPPISDPLKFIPKEAAEASVNVGINPGALYKAITEFVKENVPGGEAQIAEFTEMFKANAGMDLETDVLGWIEGGVTYFSVPGKTPYSAGDWVMMLSVNDSAKATEMLTRMIGELEPMIVSSNGSVSDAVIDGAEGFKSITHPALQMLPIGRPTLGIAAGQLMLGSSPRAIERSLATAAGKAPNFAKNERFQKEGVMPKGKVLSMSFSDTSKFGEEMGSALQMAPMLTMMPQLADVFADPSARAAVNIISKLGPVLQKIDFLLSTSAVSTIEGNRIQTKSVTNYREPPAPKTPSSDNAGT